MLLILILMFRIAGKRRVWCGHCYDHSVRHAHGLSRKSKLEIADISHKTFYDLAYSIRRCSWLWRMY